MYYREVFIGDSGILDEERAGIELRISDWKSSAVNTEPRLLVKSQSHTLSHIQPGGTPMLESRT